ncbi:MAG: phosphatase PAP2 family protein [Simkaniaceae bacterium]|nr:phosphatase PAP2 family protein [Simkaniaceae bacterium]
MAQNESSQNYQMAGLWKFKSIFKVHLMIFLLFATWLSPYTRPLWDKLDHWTFVALNHWIENSSFWQTFWAMANHKYADWLFDAFILLFVGSYIVKAPKHLKLRRVAEVLFCIIITAATIILINRLIFKDWIVIPRKSPSLVTPMSALLNEIIPWMHIKTSARFSFPGDHGTTALMFICMMNLLLDKPKALLATLVGIFFILPRLIVGAHWLTDIIIGSLSISLFTIAWTFFTPLYHVVVSKLESWMQKVELKFIHQE